MSRRSKAKRRQRRNPASNRIQRQFDENDSHILKLIGTGVRIPPVLQNANDNLVMQQLVEQPLGELRVDLFAPDSLQSLPEFRYALVKVYVIAAQARYLSKPTTKQLNAARTALSQFTRGVEKLDQINPVGQRGLELAVAGSPLDDVLGQSEVNRFTSVCRNVRMEVAPHALALKNAITAEMARPTKSGERQKRLRTLVEVLANWWQSVVGSLAPTVDANRRDDAAAVVHGRRGAFLELAVELLCHVDVFKRTEVEAAVTNVYEVRLARARSASGD